MVQLAKQEQLAKFQSFLKNSIFWTLEVTLIKSLSILQLDWICNFSFKIQLKQ